MKTMENTRGKGRGRGGKGKGRGGKNTEANGEAHNNFSYKQGVYYGLSEKRLEKAKEIMEEEANMLIEICSKIEKREAVVHRIHKEKAEKIEEERVRRGEEVGKNMHASRGELNGMFEEIRGCREQVRSIDEMLKLKRAERNKFARELPYKKQEDPRFAEENMRLFDEKVREYEEQVERNVSRPEEMRLLKKISDINKNRQSLVGGYKKAREEIEKGEAARSNLQFKIGEVQKRIDELKEYMAELRKFDVREGEERSVLGELRKQREEKSQEIYKKLDKYYDNKREEMDRKREEREKKQKEREKRDLEKQKGDVKRGFKAELTRCEQCRAYLQSYLVLSQSEDNSGEKVLSHTPEIMENFEKLSLVIPRCGEDIRLALSQVEEKQSFYEAIWELEKEGVREEEEKGKEEVVEEGGEEEVVVEEEEGEKEGE